MTTVIAIGVVVAFVLLWSKARRNDQEIRALRAYVDRLATRITEVRALAERASVPEITEGHREEIDVLAARPEHWHLAP